MPKQNQTKINNAKNLNFCGFLVYYKPDTPTWQNLDDVFLITDLISEAEITSLLPFTTVLRECTQVHVNAWREQQK